MAIVTFLLSYVARQVNNIIQAVFGWSIVALFGKLQRRAQVLVTAALVVSLAWPLFVLGVFLPRVAAWAVALVPYHDWLGTAGIRIVWIVLAVIAPLIVGVLVHIADPIKHNRLVVAALRGYQLALGFFAAFVVVAVTVPLIKASSLVRRWSDEHVYLEPHPGAYDAVFRALGEACARAGLMPEVTDAPRYMVLATNLMRTLARGAVPPIVTNDLRRIRCDGLELYLYPADLLLRGEASKVARVRAMFGRTMLDADAYLVAAPESKEIQDALATLTAELVRALEVGGVRASTFVPRLRAIYHRILAADVDYGEWILLESMARRFERRLVGAGVVGARLPLDQEPDHLPEVAARGNATTEPMTMHAASGS